MVTKFFWVHFPNVHIYEEILPRVINFLSLFLSLRWMCMAPASAGTRGGDLYC